MATGDGIQNWLEKEGSVRFKEANKLSKEESRNDPENEPYRSKYAARRILMNLKNKLDSFAADNDTIIDIKPVQYAVLYELGLNFIDTDEREAGEKYINTVYENIQELKLKPKFAVLMLKCCQQLGILWNERGNFVKSLQYFKQAEALYDEYQELEYILPLNTEMLFEVAEATKDGMMCEFEDLHTHTLYYLTQAYKNKGERKKSAKYCHKTLQRQLLSKQYSPHDWAVNAATLSQYHLTQNDYGNARHCLAAASCIMATREGVEEKQLEAIANVHICWSKYCLYLLKYSAELYRQSDEEFLAIEDKHIWLFEGLDISEVEKELPFEMVTQFKDARLLFLAGQKYLNLAKTFYQLDGYVITYVEIIQDHSQLYHYLIEFEEDLERKCKMYKRRIDMLSKLLKELNPQHYLLLCRQLTYEIASIYGDMADSKMEIVNTMHNGEPSARYIKKINSLYKNSEKFFTNFIDSFKQDGELPETFDASVVRVILLAHVYLARTHTKQICATNSERMKMQEKALEFYSYVVNYCNRDQHAATVFQDELIVCQEMVDLLPFRLNQIAQDKASI